jgi:16S rRNA (guanine527-N7)-methyltransferase
MINEIAAAAGVDVSRETFGRLEHFVALLTVESDQQNLISRGSLEEVWTRHILDSAQLLRFAPGPSSSWLDIGAGAGLPGLVIAILSQGPVTLVEPRKLRADFLLRCSQELGLGDRVTVEAVKIAAVQGPVDCLTARAVAPINRLFEMAAHLAAPHTRWILPKGRSGRKELADAQANWQGRFRTEASVTDPDAVIVVAEAVRGRPNRPKGRG